MSANTGDPCRLQPFRVTTAIVCLALSASCSPTSHSSYASHYPVGSQDLVARVLIQSQDYSGFYVPCGEGCISNAGWVLYEARVQDVLVGTYRPRKIFFAFARSTLADFTTSKSWYVRLRRFDNYADSQPFRHPYFVVDSMWSNEDGLEDWIKRNAKLSR